MSAGTRRFAVLGHPIAHSLSPKLMQAALDDLGIPAVYSAIDVAPERFDETLQALAELVVDGLNVTAPLKVLAYRRAKQATPQAELAGAANCLRRLGAGFEATNTDGAGFLDFLQEIGFEPRGKRVVLLGGGGAAAGLAAAMASAGTQLSAIVRRPQVACEYPSLKAIPVFPRLPGEMESALSVADLVINCTPLGSKASDPFPCSPELLKPGSVCVDLLYHPRVTPWLRAVAKRDHPGYNGLGLLVHQAAHSLVFWLNVEPPLDCLREAVEWESKPL